MVVTVLGSMAIKGIFKAGSLLSGLGKTAGRLKEVKQRSKSTTTEMKRMTGQTHLLSKAMAAIGVAGFTALLMTTPQLAGSLAKIKSEMQRIAWAVGKHLKPALDAVADIFRGIRTGDWSTVKQGISDLATSVLNLIATAGVYVLKVVFGKETVENALADLSNWWEKVKAAWVDGDLGQLLISFTIDPLGHTIDRLTKYWDDVAAGAKKAQEKGKAEPARSLSSAAGEYVAAVTGFGRDKYSRFDKPGEGDKFYMGGAQTGINVPREGLYHLHAGETVTMRGSTPPSGDGSTEINIDFSGANIHLASGIELDQFAQAISNKIAERQHSRTY